MSYAYDYDLNYVSNLGYAFQYDLDYDMFFNFHYNLYYSQDINTFIYDLEYIQGSPFIITKDLTYRTISWQVAQYEIDPTRIVLR